MKLSFATNFSIFTIVFLSFSFLSISHNPFILPIKKDPKTNLFSTSIAIGTPRKHFNLAIDLGGPMLWFDCNNKHYNSSTYHPIPCGSKRCPQDTGCFFCDPPFNKDCPIEELCGANIINPLVDLISFGKTVEDVFFISHSIVSGLLSGCIVTDIPFLLEGLPKNSKGIFGLARTKRSLPTQLSLSHQIPNKFALCLPSNKKRIGSIFIGGVPHQNSSSFKLIFTPLIVNPFSTAPIFSEGDASYEYFIDVKSIKVGDKVLNFNSSLLLIDNKGNGGTKISTINPFSLLHSSIYKHLVEDFVMKAKDRKIKKVATVAPFGACFDLSSIGKTISGLDVPIIDLVLEGGVEWKIYGGNSMVLVNKNVACLGFVDGGEEPRTSIVIGGHLLEDNLLEFDLVSSKLGFSSSLLLINAKCSNFRS